MKNKKLLLILVTILLVSLSIYLNNLSKNKINNINITSTTKQTNNLWLNFNNDSLSFQYPKDLTVKYISIQKWPPEIEIKQENYSCQETPKEISSLTNTITQRMVDNRIYCVNTEYEGAAGSVFASYNYTTLKDGKLISLNFILRYNNCANYNQEENQACTREREAFDLDGVVDRMIQSIEWSIKEQLKECLPKSDNISHEKCQKLLSQIKTFNDCVAAGFSIMKSNPPQCAIPDGRTFVEN